MPLYIVATPIGNLEDMTLRALRILKEVDFILCEDTRVTRTLLTRYGINKPLLSYHQHSDTKRVAQITALLKEGKALALVTDAGTPGINDPGNELIAVVIHELPQAQIIPIPGPNAVAAALSISGFPSDQFTFLGYPPHKRKRHAFFERLAQSAITTVFYESPHRIIKSLEELCALAPNRFMIVSRELTKKFERVYRGTVSAVFAQLAAEPHLRGEFVIVLAPK